MSLQSDLSINVFKLKPDAVSAAEKEFNETLIGATKKGPQWFDVGAAKYRQMRENGETALPKHIHLEQAEDIRIPSRAKGREIPCRLLTPEHGGQVKGVFLHIHGGGWVLMSEKEYGFPEFGEPGLLTCGSQDPFLQYVANEGNLAVVSVGYRLAPEHPFPQGPEDCYDAADWLADNSQTKFGAPLKFAGGESAGGHLSALTTFHLQESRPSFAFSGLVLNFGMFDMSMLPFLRNVTRPLAFINKRILEHYLDAFLPNTSPEQRRDPSISPFYADLYKMKLPPALFLCGTEDCLLEDTVLMSAKWQMAGGEAIMRLFPGAPHGFVAFPPNKAESAREGLEAIRAFLKEKVGDR